jgi:hypothetical protein
MYDIISRERAGLKEPRKRTAINESYIKGLTVHYTGAARSPSMKNIDDVFKYLKNIQTDHMVGRGWDDIGYSFAISNQSDEIIELRGFGVYSAHSGKSQINKTFISVVWLGGVNDTPNDNAKDALERLVSIIEEKYNKKIMVTGHRDHKATQCCGTPMYEWITGSEPNWKKPKRKVSKWQIKKKADMQKWRNRIL